MELKSSTEKAQSKVAYDLPQEIPSSGSGFYNIRHKFTIALGMVDIGTHMSLLKLSNGKWLIIDAIPMNDRLKMDVDLITSKGENIDAVLHTHPFHTLAVNDFYKAYSNIPHYGCPRHLAKFPEIPWAGDLTDCAVRDKWQSDVDLRIPDGSEFNNPTSDNGEHFSCVWVLHKASRTIHVDDTLMYSEDPGFLLKLGGFKSDGLRFHTSFGTKGRGIAKHPDDPFLFRDWCRSILAEWDFDHLATAHFGVKIGGAKEQFKKLLDDSEKEMHKMSEKRKNPAFWAKKNKSLSPTVHGEECG